MRAMSHHQITAPPATWRTSVLLLILFLCLPPITMSGEHDAPLQSLLDGRRFAGDTGAADEDADHRDILYFDRGLFTSDTCREYGFAPVPYRVTRDGDDLLFHAITLSPDHGRMEWRGRIRGRLAEASYSWDHQRWFWHIHREYWFRGEELP